MPGPSENNFGLEPENPISLHIIMLFDPFSESALVQKHFWNHSNRGQIFWTSGSDV